MVDNVVLSIEYPRRSSNASLQLLNIPLSLLMGPFHQLIIFKDDHRDDHDIPFAVDLLSGSMGLVVFALRIPIDVNHRDGYLNSPGLSDLRPFPKSLRPAAPCSSPFCPPSLKNSSAVTLPSTDGESWPSLCFKGSGEPRLHSNSISFHNCAMKDVMGPYDLCYGLCARSTSILVAW